MRRAAHALLFFATGASVLVAVPRDAHAYRPFDGTDADVAELGEFELELGPVHYLGMPGAHYLLAPATVLNLGVFHGVELVIDFENTVGFERVPGEARDRLLDDDVLLKFILRRGVLQGGSGISVALEAGTLTPNIGGGDKGFGASADLIMSTRWNGMTFHWNNWAELSRGDLYTSYFSGLIVEGPQSLTVRPVAEFYGEHAFEPGAPTTASALLGAIWHARDSLDFDIGLRAARTGDQPAAEIRLGLTWAFPVWVTHEDDAGAKVKD